MAVRMELVYGKSASGKTQHYLRLAEEFYVKKGKRTRIYLGDGGYETIEASGLVDAGVVEVFQYNTRPKPLETLSRCCAGWWPEDPHDSRSKLLPPDLAKLRERYDMVVFEGLTVAADYIMGDSEGGLAQRASKGEKIGQDSPIMVKDGEMTFGGNPPAHYGFAQRRLEELIEASRALPVWIQWTAHERKGEDNDTNEKEFGPDVCGKALTMKIGAHFGNTLHMVQTGKKIQQKDALTGKMVDQWVMERRMYTRKHFDPNQTNYVMYYANNRMPPEFATDMPEFLVGPDAAVDFYQKLETAKLKRVDKLKAKGLGG